MFENWKGLVWLLATLLMGTCGIVAALCAAMAAYGSVSQDILLWSLMGFVVVCAFILLSAKLFIWTFEGYFE